LKKEKNYTYIVIFKFYAKLSLIIVTGSGIVSIE